MIIRKPSPLLDFPFPTCLYKFCLKFILFYASVYRLISGVPLRARFVSGLSKDTPKVKPLMYLFNLNKTVLSSEHESLSMTGQIVKETQQCSTERLDVNR